MASTIESDIIATLTEALQPEMLALQNDSARHKGHKGGPNGDNTHFTLRIKAKGLNGKTRVQQHRYINQLLEPFFRQGLHALSIQILP